MILGDALPTRRRSSPKAARTEVGGVPARQRYVRHGDEERRRRGDAEIQHALRDQGDDLYDPTARDLSVEVSKAKATGADALLVVSRLNDAILLTRELVKQRWSPMGILSMGPGWYEDQYLKTLAKLGDGTLSFVPWYDPTRS